MKRSKLRQVVSGAMTFAVCCVLSEFAVAQEIVVAPPDAPRYETPGTHGTTVYEGPAPGSGWFCGTFGGVAEPVGEVAAGEQYLRDDGFMPLEQLVPTLHQVALADAGERLPAGPFPGLAVMREPVAARRLRPAGDNHDLATVCPQPLDLTHEF